MATEERLIPGLPEELVVTHVVPRLPWYARPVCRAISKSWRACLETCKQQQHKPKTRKYQLPLLTGLFVICTDDTQLFITRDRVAHDDDDDDNNEKQRATYYAVSGLYQIHRQWRRLPPLQDHCSLPKIIASSGMVFMWSHKEPSFVFKLDLGCGEWTWTKFPAPVSFEDAIDFNGKIYGKVDVPRIPEGWPKVQAYAYDMITDRCELVERWYHDNLRVLRKKCSGSTLQVEEKMYSFVEDDCLSESKLQRFVYDASGDSWRNDEEIRYPEWRWSELPQVKLLSGECFEPASVMDANTVWIDSGNEVISWFSSSEHKTWVTIGYNSFLEGKFLDYLQFIRGSLFGLFCEEKEDQDDENEENKDSEKEVLGGEQDPRLSKRTIMKGKICVANNIVEWEEMQEVGCFDEVSPAASTLIACFTLMT